MRSSNEFVPLINDINANMVAQFFLCIIVIHALMQFQLFLRNRKNGKFLVIINTFISTTFLYRIYVTNIVQLILLLFLSMCILFFDHKKYDPYNHDSRYFYFILHAMMSTTQCIECNGVERRYFYDDFHFHKNHFFG